MFVHMWKCLCVCERRAGEMGKKNKLNREAALIVSASALIGRKKWGMGRRGWGVGWAARWSRWIPAGSCVCS